MESSTALLEHQAALTFPYSPLGYLRIKEIAERTEYFISRRAVAQLG